MIKLLEYPRNKRREISAQESNCNFPPLLFTMNEPVLYDPISFAGLFVTTVFPLSREVLHFSAWELQSWNFTSQQKYISSCFNETKKEKASADQLLVLTWFLTICFCSEESYRTRKFESMKILLLELNIDYEQHSNSGFHTALSAAASRLSWFKKSGFPLPSWLILKFLTSSEVLQSGQCRVPKCCHKLCMNRMLTLFLKVSWSSMTFYSSKAHQFQFSTEQQEFPCCGNVFFLLVYRLEVTRKTLLDIDRWTC